MPPRPGARGSVRTVLAAMGLAALLPMVRSEGQPSGAASDLREMHAALQLEVLARAATLAARIDRIGDGFVRPLNGPISSGFGWRAISVAGNRFHGGLDIAAHVGTPIAAARGGVVVRAGWTGIYGYHVVLDHGGGWETRYAHLSRLDVAEGERVRQGAVLGLVGSTGASTGPHLHFEIRFDGRALDPLTYLGR